MAQLEEKTKKDEKGTVEKRVVTARYSDANSSPQKMRLVADLVRGKNAQTAVDVLTFTNKKAAKTLLKLLKSALSSADTRYNIGSKDLVVSNIDVGEGIKLPRSRIASRGRVTKIMKRRSLVNIELKEK